MFAIRFSQHVRAEAVAMNLTSLVPQYVNTPSHHPKKHKNWSRMNIVWCVLMSDSRNIVQI